MPSSPSDCKKNHCNRLVAVKPSAFRPNPCSASTNGAPAELRKKRSASTTHARTTAAAERLLDRGDGAVENILELGRREKLQAADGEIARNLGCFCGGEVEERRRERGQH